MSAAGRLAGSQALEGVGFSILDFRLLPLFPRTCCRRFCLLTSDSPLFPSCGPRHATYRSQTISFLFNNFPAFNA